MIKTTDHGFVKSTAKVDCDGNNIISLTTGSGERTLYLKSAFNKKVRPFEIEEIVSGLDIVKSGNEYKVKIPGDGSFDAESIRDKLYEFYRLK